MSFMCHSLSFCHASLQLMGLSMANTNDLRYIRTEDAIRTAFMDLVADTPVSSVTVSAVCKHANISRNAFYLHHSSVTALYSSLVDELITDIRDESMQSAARVNATSDVDVALPSAIISVMGKHEKLLRALLPADNGSLAKQLAEALEQVYVDAALLIDNRGGSHEHRLSCAFAASAHVGFVTRWIAESSRPIEDARPLFEALQTGLSEHATRYLTAEL